MGYPKNIYDEADKIMMQRRNKAKSELMHRQEKIYKELPEIQSLENQTASLSTQAIRCVISGKFDRNMLEQCKTQSLELQAKIKEMLVANGYDEYALDENYYCEKCKDTGYIDGIMCDCMKSLVKETACKTLSSMSNAHDCSLDNFSLEYYPDVIMENSKISPRKKMSRIFDYCKNYVKNFNTNAQSILMQGATGLGKTHLSIAMAYEITKRGYGVIYCSAPEIMRQLEQEYFGKANSENKTNDTESALIECDLLIVDDLGTEYSNKYNQSAIYNIINSRINMNRPTIISTNLNATELNQLYGMRFVSRMIGEFDKLDFVGSDIRQIKARS
ncbi:MAG: ATP-binding protein [Clostridia bacterium]|nr:ATP-binding protein [Clostridia bacterium]